MVCRTPGVPSAVVKHQCFKHAARTFHDIFDAGPISGQLKRELWRLAAFHVGGAGEGTVWSSC